jgi:hypothetical protein
MYHNVNFRFPKSKEPPRNTDISDEGEGHGHREYRTQLPMHTRVAATKYLPIDS